MLYYFKVSYADFIRFNVRIIGVTYEKRMEWKEIS